MVVSLSSQKEYISLIDSMIQEIERENTVPMKRYSNEVVNYCATKSDYDYLYLAVIFYLTHKAMSQTHLVNNKSWKRDKELLLGFYSNLKKVSKQNIKLQLQKLVLLFKNSNNEFYNYFRNLERKGRVKIGARLFSYGFTLKKIIELMNINLYELQDYISETMLYNQKDPETIMKKKVSLLLSETRDLIFDSSALISIGNSGIIDIFEEFKKRNPNINLYITESVHNETIDIKDKVKKYSWVAIQYEYLIKKGIFKLIPNSQLKNQNINNICNDIFSTKHGKLEILQKGELDSVSFAKDKNAVLVIDEIITRWLIENPLKLHELMESRYKEKVIINKQNLNNANSILKNLPVIRSVDFIAFAIKKGYFEKYLKYNLDFKKSLLYSLKYSGCATTYEEIDSYVRSDK